MAGKKQYYRLFKVAKELNVGTAMLVNHLEDHGHAVENSPNTKLNSEQYDVLLKEFASEKLMKEKAEELSERRKEEARAAVPETPAPPAEEEEEKDPLSIEQLRNRMEENPAKQKPADKEPSSPAQTTPVSAPSSQEKPADTKEPAKEPVSEEKPQPKPQPEAKPEPKPEVKEAAPLQAEEKPEEKAKPQEEPKEEKAEKEEEMEKPQLKVVGKIDLDQVGKPSKRKAAEKPAEKSREKAAVPEAKERPAPEKKLEEKAPAPQPEQPVANEQPSTSEEKVTPTEKPAEQPVSTEKEEVPVKKEEESTSGTIIRAGDSTKQLSGLKVVGKIDLPGSARKDDKKASDEDDDKPKKRRRRRKRKRKTAVTADDSAAKTGGDTKTPAKRGGRKEKPSEKDVEESIKTTLSRLDQSPSRRRQRLRRAKRDAAADRREAREMEERELDRVIEVTEFITANEFANLITVPVNDIIKKSFELGMMVSINQRLDAEVLSIIAEEYGYEAKFVDVTDNELEVEEVEDRPDDLKTRAPILTVMGHVDHGKTTLLDHLRKTSVTSTEAGGITQHIGAYEVTLKNGHNVTFLDTPGHEAFTAMRARGAKVTDVAIIVVAADDEVMPQTKEAINHAKAAGVSMVFAINKMDKDGANPDRIKTQLAELGYMVEDWGGKFQSQEISALKGDGVDDLLEKVILEAEILELKANPDRSSTGTVIEARLDRGRGNVATVLVQNGTLKVGDEVVAGIHYGKVRALIDQNGERLKEAGPATPVQLLGLSGQPQAGDRFYVFEEEGRAKELAQKRSELYREQQLRRTNRLTLEEIGRRRALGNFKELNIIIRGDVDGSVEALAGALLKLSTDEVQVNIIGKGVGAITEADINLAIASDAIVLAFNVRPNAQARSLAEREEVDIRPYSVIYDAIGDVKDALEGLLSPEIKEEIMGTAEVREVFRITKVGTVAGGVCASGRIKREDPVRLIRDGVVIYDNRLASLKRFKDDVKEVLSGQEFGFSIKDYQDYKEGDTIESYHVNEIRRTL